MKINFFMIVGVLSIAMMPFSYFVISPYINNGIFRDFSAGLDSIVLPHGMEEVTKLNVIGQQIGNSDHCDYLKARIVKTDLERSEAEALLKESYLGEPPLKFLWKDDFNFYTSDANRIGAIWSLSDWIVDESEKTQANLIMYVFDVGLISWDYRCGL